MDFDLGLAVREDSENPVYYVQYAHARICTLLKTLAAEGYTVPAADEVDFSLLSGEAEQALIKQLAALQRGGARWPHGTTTPATSTATSRSWPRAFHQLLHRLPHQGRGEARAAGAA